MTTITTRADFIAAWANLADAKLRVERVDTSDLTAVEQCLLRCVGGRRLWNSWVEFHRKEKAQ